MKRDIDLIRAILLTIEASPTGYGPYPLKVEGYSDEQVGYHAYLLMQGGLVEGTNKTLPSSTSPLGHARNLTWRGHEFLDAARDPGIWQTAKERAIAAAGGATVPIMYGLLRAAHQRKDGD
ncbi:MAG: DUF2513 domain-containing protein [Planctomycetes bacterium]|nr:DUF2513 domain-containing protein [Planctomycetota bacterium]